MYTHAFPDISVPAYTGVHSDTHTYVYMHAYLFIHGSRRVDFGVYTDTPMLVTL